MQNARKVKTLGGLTLASSLVWMGLLPAVSFAASATVTSVTLTGPAASQIVAGNTVTFTAKATDPSGTPEYQFFWTGPNGSGHTTYSTKNTYSITLQPGDYAVQVYALDQSQVAAKDWPAHKQSAILPLHVSAATASNVQIQGPANSSLNPGAQKATFTASATAPAGTTLYYQFVVADNTGKVLSYTHYSTDNTATLNLPVGQTVVWVNVLTADQVMAKDWKAHTASTPLAYNIAAYGAPAAVKLTAATATLVADGMATDTITATVEDAFGNTVADFNGTVTVTAPNGAGTFNGNPSTTITLVNGVGTATLTAPAANPGTTETLVSSALAVTSGPAPAANVSYGDVALAYATPTAGALSVSSAYPDLAVNSATQDTITVSTLDQAGNPVNASTPVTLTISGPATFVANGQSTYSTYLAGGSVNVQIESEQGVTGTVTVTATASGLTTGSVSVPAVVVGAPANLKVTASSGTTAQGVPFTVYTIYEVDANGNVITTGNDTVEVTDNAGTLNGEIDYYTYDAATGQPDTWLGYDSSGPIPLTNGVAQVVAEASVPFTGQATLTFTDTTHNFAVNQALGFQAGSAASLALTDNNPNVSLDFVTNPITNTATQYVEAGGATLNVYAQLLDANGNPVAQAGMPVTFSLSNNSAGATFPTGSTSYVADTNASGLAAVTVDVPAGAGAGSTVDVTATFPGSVAPPPSLLPDTIDYTVESAANYATQVVFSNNATELTGGSRGTATATAENAVGTPVTNSTQWLAWTSSNSGSVWLGANTVGTQSGSQLSLLGEKPGSATVTAVDVSEYTMPSASYTVQTTTGPLSTISAFDMNGNDLSSFMSNGDSLAAGATMEINLVAGDAAGNPVPVNASYQVTLPQSPAGVNWRLSPTGPNITSVTFTPGQTEQTVYLVNGTGGTLTVSSNSSSSTNVDVSTTPSGLQVTLVPVMTITPSPSSLTFSCSLSSCQDYTTQYVTVTVSDANGPVAGQEVSWWVTGYGTASTTGSPAVTNAAGQVTIPVSVGAIISANTDTLHIMVGSTINGSATEASVSIND